MSSLNIPASCSKFVFLNKYWLNVKFMLNRNFSFFVFFKKSNLLTRYFFKSSFSHIAKSRFISALTLDPRLVCHLKTASLKHIKKIQSTALSFSMSIMWLNLRTKNAIDTSTGSNFISTLTLSLAERWQKRCRSRLRSRFRFLTREFLLRSKELWLRVRSRRFL